jgi:ABC-2 type transport system ATP-binding protein
MIHIRFDRAEINFTIYQSSTRLFRREIIRTAVGGLIGSSKKKNRTVVQALRDISLVIESGERVGLVGHNGAGKTTLLRAMAGIYRPTAGRFEVEGRCVPLFDIGLGFDEEASGYENILLRGLLMGLSRKDIEQRADEIAAFSGLGEFLSLPVRTYSSGMALRLLFSIATSIDSDILLMDEWIVTGDESFIAKAEGRLRQLVDRAHILVVASHDLDLLKSLCTRCLLLENGQIVGDGVPADIIDRYRRRL